jgi:NADPH-dependent 2,4-dienoyl-CoA reductase/sulfur reductase-like enzyme
MAERVAVVGGGLAGCEAASVLARAGIEVDLL